MLVVCLMAWLLFRLGLHDNARAALLTGSNWLASFGVDPGPSWGNAWRQGLWGTLLYGDVSYNTSLWTMRIELVGSFVSLGAAAVIVRILPLSRVLTLVLGLLGYMWLLRMPLALSPFLAGVTLSAALAGARLPRLPLPVGLGLCAAALYLFGFTQAAGAYAWLSVVPVSWIAGAVVPVLSSVAVIFAVESCPRLRAGLGVPVFLWLGRISFGLYLVHFLVIISAASFVRVLLNRWGTGLATTGAFVVTLTVSLAAATPLSWFDGWLIGTLNTLVDRLLPRRLTLPRDAAPTSPNTLA